MRKRLVKLLLERTLPQVCPYDEFFAAGPPVAQRRHAAAPALATRSEVRGSSAA
jgi:hypothetical protein